MKKLTLEELSKMSLKDAWVIVNAFSDFLDKQEHNLPFEFDDVLPYEKYAIQVAFVVILQKDERSKNKEFIDVIGEAFLHLNGFIPSEKEYAEMLQVMKKTRKALKTIRK